MDTNNNNLLEAKNQLKNFKQVIQNEDYDKAAMQFLLAEVYRKIKGSPVVYSVSYTLEHHQNHFVTYKNLARRYKAKLLNEISEIAGELRKPKPNNKRINQLLETILVTNLYRSTVQNKIYGFTALKGTPITPQLPVYQRGYTDNDK